MADAVFGYGASMEGDRKGPPKPTIARFALAANLKDLMANYRLGFLTGINAPELQQGCGVHAKTIRRILDPYSDISPNLETIDALADFFKLQSWELIKPRDRQPAVSGRERQTREGGAQSVGATQQDKKSKSRKIG